MSLKEILKSTNVVELLDDDQRKDITDQVLTQFTKDKQSRAEKLRELEDIVKLSLSVTEDKSPKVQVIMEKPKKKLHPVKQSALKKDIKNLEKFGFSVKKS